MLVQDMDIPYHSQHTMSRNHRPASEVPFKNGRKEGGGGCVCVWGGGDRLESPVETHSFLWFFFSHVLLFLYGLGGGGGGVNC